MRKSNWKILISEEELEEMACRKAREEYIDDYRDYVEGFKAGCKEILNSYLKRIGNN